MFIQPFTENSPCLVLLEPSEICIFEMKQAGVIASAPGPEIVGYRFKTNLMGVGVQTKWTGDSWRCRLVIHSLLQQARICHCLL